MPRMNAVREEELQRSSRGKAISEFIQNPASGDVSEVKLTAASRAMLSVREKSSTQFSDCIAAPAVTEVPRTTSEGRPTTRTAMMAMRKEVSIAENEAIGKNARATLPVGVQPGAPGRNPTVGKFSADDVHRCIGHPPK